MGRKHELTGPFEQLVLLALLRLRDNAYGIRVRDEIALCTGRNPSLGAVYTTLERLETKGFVSSHEGEKTALRGGRAKRYFLIEGGGLAALKAAHDATCSMTAGLEPILEAR
jgi:PadR family transcriptional regulator, regulatory protein PadR